MENRIIGERIARRRKELGMTQKQLADRLYITDRAVSRWERGVGAPDLSLIVPLCEALSLSTDELLRGVSPEPPHSRPRPDDTPHLIPFRQLLLTYLTPLLWPLLAILTMCIPKCPQWLALTAAFSFPLLMPLTLLLCMSRFFRCPRCGHILWDFTSPRATRALFSPSADNCPACGKAVFIDCRALYRLLDFLKNDRPR